MRLIILSLIAVLLLIANLYFGAVNFSLVDITSVLLSKSDNEALKYIILESRLPQGLTALLAGAGLSAGGLMLQTIFRNPLAGPSILGISSGSSLGVAIVLLLMGGTVSFGESSLGLQVTVMLGALTGSAAVLVILLILAERIKNNLTLLIVGMMTGYLTSSIVTLLSSSTSARGIQSFVYWGMGSFSGTTLGQLPMFGILVILGIILAFLLVKPLNLLLLGENYAVSLGVNVRAVRRILLISSGLLTAVITAVCGPISFIGLAMPHIAQMIMRTENHLQLLPATVLCGAILALLVNVISVIPGDYVIPINALTPIAGVPVILYVILKKRNK